MRTDFSEMKSVFSGFRISRSTSKSEIRISQSNATYWLALIFILQTDISPSSPFSDLKVLSRISLQNSRNILRGSHRMLITHMSPWVIFFYICPAGNILKTNLTKFVVIWSEKASIGMFLWIRSKITLTKEKEMRKRKRNGCTSSFYNGYFGDNSWPKKFVGHKKSIWWYSRNPRVRTYIFPSLAKQVLIFGGSYW